VNDRGEIEKEAFAAALGSRTKLVAITHVSNALGTINPLEELIPLARAAGARVLVDGAQAVPHMPVDVQALDCDFYAFSGHKLFGPSGIGVLWGRLPLLEAMPPFMGGGGMIERVSFDHTTYAAVPEKFEAGTPDIAGAVGLGAAIDYVSALGLENIARWEEELLTHANEQLHTIPGLRIIGTSERKAAVISFVLDGIHAHDVGTILDQQGVAVRVGHHCAQPLMECFGIAATTRASFSIYNTHDDVTALTRSLAEVRRLFD
jgi:cysteine desulfurase/selenocysteine lyase